MGDLDVEKTEADQPAKRSFEMITPNLMSVGAECN